MIHTVTGPFYFSVTLFGVLDKNYGKLAPLAYSSFLCLYG